MKKRASIEIYPQVFEKLLREYFGGSVEELASEVGREFGETPHERKKLFERWIKKGGKATLTQVKKLSEKFLVPYMVFYVQNPEYIPPRVRQIDNRIRRTGIPYDERKLLRKVEIIQANIEGLIEVSPDIDEFTRRHRTGEIRAIAEALRELLDFPIEVQVEKLRNSWEVFQYLRRRIENLGIGVIRLPFNPEILRGSVLHGSVPIIMISTKDNERAQIFTLIHELCHILTKRSVTSEIEICRDFELEHHSAREMEVYCNRLADNFLLPASIAVKEFTSMGGSVMERIYKISDKYKVSRQMVRYRLLEMGIKEPHEVMKLMDEGTEHSEKGSRFKTTPQRRIINRYGLTILNAIAEGLESDVFTTYEAMRLIGIRKEELFRRVMEERYAFY